MSFNRSQGPKRGPSGRGKLYNYASSSSFTNQFAEKKFDPESGQVYSEVEVRASRTKHLDWIREFSTPRAVIKPAPSAKGARSLADVARAKVVTEFSNLAPEHFASIPWTMAENIWEHVVATRAETFHAWRTLAAVYSEAEEFGQRRYRYFIRLKQPSLPLTDYYRGIASPELKWLTCLRVCPQQLLTQDLVSVHTITNLAVLDVSNTGNEYSEVGSSFDERLMLSWTQLAASGQAFQHLRVLMFGWQATLDRWIFKYTQRFPSLCHIIVTDCPHMHQKNRAVWEKASQTAGWEARHAKRSAKSLRPIIRSEHFHAGSISGCYYESQDLFSQLAHSRRPILTQQLPILEIWLGTPRPWSHIVDDFPGHRTIWFDRVSTPRQMGTEEIGVGSNCEQPKRSRNEEQAAPGTASPPPKRGPTTRPAMRPVRKNLADMLQEFKA
ncbi:hypothetical protein G647_02022 [Cladophialophora carrionii CBS 160.54]|uniref:Uncharacterized protein n=1 Tax=Cladophialophora carrionii CBS 160.54 TaxID=1279043 RepID=V9DRP8_9EURO|nr:uncharacterized protein G647_02022 [Cladophialophora carrionii CBS 160.54]ETI29569.1 hypothetical protein G647_02022 [Cladophialophora carrionii CBS 160.54]